MKYFTPERWLALQDVSTREAFEAARAGWEEALAGYRAGLDRVNDRLSPELNRFARSVCLHDGVLVSSSLSEPAVGQRQLSLLVQPEGDGDHLFKLQYELIGDPVVVRGVLPSEWTSDGPGWAYDEVGVEGDGTLTHNVLFRDGTELRLRFKRFACFRVPRSDKTVQDQTAFCFVTGRDASSP